MNEWWQGKTSGSREDLQVTDVCAATADGEGVNVSVVNIR